MDGRPRPALLLVGPTGSGKTPLGHELERRGLLGRPCLHFDFGAELRAVAAAPEGEGPFDAEELAAVRASLATGALFEDRDLLLVLKVLSRFAESAAPKAGALLVLNGLPRHERQAEAIEGLVAVERVVSLEADAEVIGARLRLDPGGDRADRADDGPAAVAGRLAEFRRRTLPLLEYYRRRGVQVCAVAVTASMTPAEAYEALVRTIRVS